MAVSTKDSNKLNRIPVSSLKKNTTYYLTYDFWPYGGTAVKFIGFIRSKLGDNSSAKFARLKSEDGGIFLVRYNTWLYTAVPCMPVPTTGVTCLNNAVIPLR
jgi:hypothetical protein